MTHTGHVAAQTAAAVSSGVMSAMAIPVVVRVMPVVIMITPAIGPVRIAPVIGVRIP